MAKKESAVKKKVVAARTVATAGRTKKAKGKLPARKKTARRAAAKASADLGRTGKKVRGEAGAAALPSPVKKGSLAAKGKAAVKQATTKKPLAATTKRMTKGKKKSVRPAAGSWGSDRQAAAEEPREPAKLAKAFGRRAASRSTGTFKPGGVVASIADESTDS